MKYQDTMRAAGTPQAGRPLAANGEYVGEQIGTPMQGKGETAANADPFSVAHATAWQGTLLQDAADANFPKVAVAEGGGT